MSRKKRRPSPAFPMYPKDFLGDVNTITMSAEEVGAYTLLLLHAWEQGAELPNDLDELAALARIQRPRFDELWSRKLSRCFTVARSKRTVSNPRQRREAEKQRRYSAAQAAKARKRWDNDDAAAQPGDSPGSAGGMPPTPPTPAPPPASSEYVRTSIDSGSEPSTCTACPPTGEHWGLVDAGTARQRACDCERGRDRAKRYAQDKQRKEDDAKARRRRPRVADDVVLEPTAVDPMSVVPSKRVLRG